MSNKTPMEAYYEQLEKEEKERNRRFREAVYYTYGMLQISSRRYQVIAKQIGHFAGSDLVPIIQYIVLKGFESVDYETAYSEVARLNREERKKIDEMIERREY